MVQLRVLEYLLLHSYFNVAYLRITRTRTYTLHVYVSRYQSGLSDINIRKQGLRVHCQGLAAGS